MENTTNNTVFWTMEEVNLLKFRESDSLCWFFAKIILLKIADGKVSSVV